MLGISPKRIVEKTEYNPYLNKFLTRASKNVKSDVLQVADTLTTDAARLNSLFVQNGDFNTALELASNYIAKLQYVSKRFTFAPSSSNDSASLPISFHYHETFEGHKPSKLYNVEFEMAAVATNLAALASRAGVDMKAHNLVDACTLFRKGAGIYDWIVTNSAFSNKFNGCIDVSPTAATFFFNLMLAQAQLCLFEKACATFVLNREAAEKGEKVTVAMGPATIAQLASGCSELYGRARGCLEHDPKARQYFMGPTFDTKDKKNKGKQAPFDWAAYAEHQRLSLLAAANMWQGKAELDQNGYGLEISYLSFAQQFAEQAAVFDDMLTPYAPKAIGVRKDLYERVGRRLVAAKKDNFSCYFQHIPNTVKNVASKILATPVPFVLANVPDPYAGFLNPAIQAALDTIQAETNSLFEEEKKKADDCTYDTKKKLDDLDVASLIAGDKGIPDELVKRMQQYPQAQAMIQDMLSSTASLNVHTKTVIDAIRSDLDEETAHDAQLRSKYPSTTLIPSPNVNRDFYMELQKLSNYLVNAAATEEKLAVRVRMNRKEIELIEKNPIELSAMIPAESLDGNTAALKEKLQAVLGTLSQAVREKDASLAAGEKAFNEWKNNLIPSILKGSSVDEEKEAVRVIISSMKIGDKTSHEERLLRDVEGLVQQLKDNRGIRESPRTIFLNSLLNGCKLVEDVRKQTEEGKKFYNDLTNSLVEKLRLQVKEFIAKRDMERHFFKDQQNKSSYTQAQLPPQQQGNYYFGGPNQYY